MEKRAEVERWIDEIQKRMSESQGYWDELRRTNDKLTDCLKRRDELLVYILRELGKEQQQQKETENEFKDSLALLSRGMEKIDESLSSGFARQDVMWQQLEEENRKKDQELSKCRNSVVSLEREKRGWEAEKSRLKEEKKKLEEEKSELSNQLREMERQRGESGDTEVGQAIELYNRYKSWHGEEKDQLKRLTDADFWEFVNRCSDEGRIEYIFQGLKDMVWEEKDQEGINVMNDIIDFCIRRQNAQGRKIQRQSVEKNDIYSGSSHQKREGGQSYGYVKRVLMQGVKDDDGVTLEGCRAFVEIE